MQSDRPVATAGASLAPNSIACVAENRSTQQGNPMSDELIELAARTAHEVNRAYCLGLYDDSQPGWEDAPEWQRSSAIKGAQGVLAGNGPEQSHESWLEEKRATGWKHGPVKDADKKEHPCFVPYDQLPAAQKFKDTLFVNAVKGVLVHHGALKV